MLRSRPLPFVTRTRAAIFGLLLAAAVLPLVVPLLSPGPSLQPGERAPSSLEALHGAQYVSEPLTELARQDAADAVEEVYLPPRPAVRDAQVGALNRFLSQVDVIRKKTNISAERRLEELNGLQAAQPVSPTGRANLLLLDDSTFTAFVQRAPRALGEIMDRGVRENTGSQSLAAYLAVPGNVPPSATELIALQEVLRGFIAPNIELDQVATGRLREEARGQVLPVVVTYTPGQVIIGEGQTLEESHIEALRQTGVIDSAFDYLDALAGTIIALGFGAGLALFAYVFQPFTDPAGRRMVLTGLVIAGVLLAVRVAIPTFTPDNDSLYLAFALPVAAAAMTAATFGSLPFALVVAISVSLFAAFIGATASDLPGAAFVNAVEGLELAIAFAAGSMAGALVVHRADRISRYAVAAVAVSAVSGLVMLAFWLLNEPRTTESLGWLALAAGLNGAGSAVLALGVFVLLSMALGVTTRLQLLELAQADHPLLRRLQEEAPGTFHHSMMVGSLAEAGADAIGADALLAKTGAYYHDIGKLAKPGYYIENMLDGKPSPHDALSPVESAAVIRDHVTNGIDLARRYRLPACIRDIVPEHHGTRLVTFFYRKAAEEGEVEDPAAYRYPGPRPATRESAIVMLADSCEAVVRAQQNRDRTAIDATIDAVFAERLAEGQLDDCPITMRELQAVAATFKSTLRAVYHPRIEYPKPTPEEIAAIAAGSD
jgi:cyclic-di-AMP phosphodiesterase PgpH